MIDAFVLPVESCFLKTAEISLHASLIIGVLLLARPLLKRLLAPRWVYALWFIVILRMLLVDLPSLPAASDPAVRQSLAAVDAVKGEGGAWPLIRAIPVPAPAGHLDAWALVSLTWAAGVAVFLIGVAIGHFRWSRRLTRTATRPVREIEALVEEVRTEMEVRKVGVVQMPGLVSPFITRLFRPTIVLPEDLAERFSADEFRWIVRHELAHLKRGDLWVQALCQVLQAVHWFNPVVWLGFACLRRDRELACDTYVLDRQPATPHAYGHALIKVAETYPRSLLSPAFLGVAEESADLQERVQKISRHRRPARLWIAVSAFFCVMLAGFFLVRQAEPPHEATAKFVINTNSMNGVSAEVEVIQSESVVVPAMRTLGLDKTWAQQSGSGETVLTAPEIMDRVSKILSVTRPDPTMNIVYVTVKTNPPAEAAQIANAIVAEYRRQINAASLPDLVAEAHNYFQNRLNQLNQMHQEDLDQFNTLKANADPARPVSQADLDRAKAKVDEVTANIAAVNQSIEQRIADNRAAHEASDVRILANAY